MAPKFDDDPFAQSANELRRHLTGCAQCRLAMDEKGWATLCRSGDLLCLRVAHNLTSLLALKRKAAMDPGGYVYACPDLSKHGTAYSLSAMPFSVHGTQEELF